MEDGKGGIVINLSGLTLADRRLIDRACTSAYVIGNLPSATLRSTHNPGGRCHAKVHHHARRSDHAPRRLQRQRPDRSERRDLAPNFAQEPVPGQSNCRGQLTAAVAQAGKNEGLEGVRGVGGAARFLGIPVKDLKAAIDAACAEEEPV